MCKYGIDKEQCRKMIKGVCSGCGGELNPMKTVDNADNPTYWGGCIKCQKFCWGVDKKIWKIARNLTEKGILTYYGFMKKDEYSDTKERKEYWLNTQTSGAIRIVREVLREWKELK